MEVTLSDNQDFFHEVFPFSFSVNESLEFISTGDSLIKVTGEIIGHTFQSQFEVQRPYLEEVSFVTLSNLSRTTVYLKHIPSNLLFRGEIKTGKNRTKLLFIVSLWITDIEVLKQYKITYDCFAAHDSTFDFLHVLKQSAINENELMELISRIDKQSLEIKQSNEALTEATSQLQSILNEMQDVVWSLSMPDLKTLFITPSLYSLVEISEEQWMSDRDIWKKFIHPNDLPVVAKMLSDLPREHACQFEYRIVTPSGKLKWLRNKWKYVFDESGKPVRIDGLITDITTAAVAQQALDQEIRLQNALIDIASTYINLDPKEVEATINQSLQKMGVFVSADRSYIFDYNFHQRTTSNTYEWCNEGVEPEIENLQQVPMEYFPQWVEQHQKGEAFYIQDVSALSDDGEGGLKSILQPQGIKSLIAIPMLDGKDLVGFVGFDSVKKHHHYSDKEKRLLFLFGQMLINIRNRQKWENQLRLQEEKYRNILANMNLGLLEVDLNDVIIFANQSFCSMSGYHLEELKGQIAADLFVADHHKNIIYEKNNKRLNALTDSYEIEVFDKAGQPHWWFVSGAPNYNDRGQLIGSIGIHLDITKQKHLEQELATAKTFAESAAKAKELFLANMSHEIRTPLNVIIGMIRQLTKENLSPDQHFYVKQSESSARHLLTILNNVLDIAKIESGDMEIIQNAFSPSALVYNLRSIMYSQAKEKGIDLKIIISPDIKPALLGDETRLRQVLINLVGNAIKFTQHGSILISVELQDEDIETQTLKFVVTDTGIGMSEEFLSKIFDKFSQEQTAINRKFEGTGLGMAISKDLIGLMGGHLTVSSKKNKGTTCTFILKLPIGQQDQLVSKSEQVKANAFNGMKALLVEDNEMNRFIAVQSLDYLGFSTEEAENGQVAIEILKSQKFDLILMDIQMPVMDGVETTVYVREQLKDNTPIIALTANAFKHDIDLYLSKGMNDYITKPYDEQDFFRKIDHILGLAYALKVNKAQNPSSPGSKEPTPALYDLSLLEQMSRGNQDFVKKMVLIFIKLARENSMQFRSAMEQNEWEVLQRAAHKIKPSIDQMGIVSLKEDVRKLEKFDFEMGNLIELQRLVDILSKTLLQVADELEKKF